MQHYVIDAELDRRPPDDLAPLIDALDPVNGAITTSPAGNLAVTITIPANTIAQACALAAPVLAEHGPILILNVQPEHVRDAREGWAPLPDLMGATQAAEHLGVTRQQIHNLVTAGRLPGQKIGRDWVIQSAAVHAMAEDREDRLSVEQAGDSIPFVPEARG